MLNALAIAAVLYCPVEDFSGKWSDYTIYQSGHYIFMDSKMYSGEGFVKGNKAYMVWWSNEGSQSRHYGHMYKLDDESIRADYIVQQDSEINILYQHLGDFPGHSVYCKQKD